MTYKTNRQSGFVILYAVIVASVVSLSGILLGNIIVKQIILSSIGRESQFAYYAADMADECIHKAFDDRQFGEYIEDPFAPSPGYGFFPEDNPTFLCDVVVGDIQNNPLASPDSGRNIIVNIEKDGGQCITSDIVWKIETDGGILEDDVVITSSGYNICDENHPRRVEKVIYRNK